MFSFREGPKKNVFSRKNSETLGGVKVQNFLKSCPKSLLLASIKSKGPKHDEGVGVGVKVQNCLNLSPKASVLPLECKDYNKLKHNKDFQFHADVKDVIKHSAQV